MYVLHINIPNRKSLLSRKERRVKIIKVLKNNFNNVEIENDVKPYPRKLICENCKSELEYEESDLRMGEYGCMYIDCPVCKDSNMLEDNEHSIRLTVDNIKFPIHFRHTSEATGAKNVCTNEEIKKCIRQAVDYFREHEDKHEYYTSYGNLYINVHRYDGDEEYEVLVSNDFYETFIPFEPEDY